MIFPGGAASRKRAAMHRRWCVQEILEVILIICRVVVWCAWVRTMSDWVRDWRRWSRGERALAIALVVTLMAALPIGLLLGIAHPGV